MYHPESDVNRLYLPRKERGRGLELSLKISVIGMDTYLNYTNDWMLKLVKKHEENKRMHSITTDATTYLKILHLLKKQKKLRHRQKLKILMNSR